MTYNIIATPEFKKELKRLIKHYPSFKEDFRLFALSLSDNPFQGVDLGHGVRKIRIQISSKNKGKSGGARALTLTLSLDQDEGTIYLFCLYDKSERSTIKDSEISELLKKNGL